MDKKGGILEDKRAAILNLGCKVNKYESDAMADKLKSAGMQIVEPEEIADVYIVNTCSVTNMAQKKSRQMLRRVRKKNPSAVIIAAGCYVNAEHEVLLKEDFIDILVGNNRKKDIVHVITQYLESKKQEDRALSTGNPPSQNTDFYVDINCVREYEEMGNIDVSAMDHRRAYIKIQDGCNQFCSYCIIPYTRGRVRSREKESILSEIEQLAEDGVKEFVLTGIHISSYGTDFGEGDLADLIWAVEQLPMVKRIRLGSLE
ncbi:MAG: radical SAM protein, partial [Lachnospiraceae bacterium]|nr:radical SAM protein [Lachnospiraceae bacterium]